MSKFFWRVTGAAMLNPAAYEDVEADSSAGGQAALVVVLSSLAAGIGALSPERFSIVSFVIVALFALAVWVVWAYLTFEIGARILPSRETRSNPGELMRTIGFSTAPGIFRVLAVLPDMRLAVFAVTAVWMLVAMIVAVRQALDYTSTARAVAVCGIGWTLAVCLALITGVLWGPSLY